MGGSRRSIMSEACHTASSQFTGRDADLDETLTRPLKRNVKERKRVVCSV
jgi:hypothetical protein